jgi:hypothetical protein
LDGEALRRASGGGERKTAVVINTRNTQGRYGGTCGENERGETRLRHGCLL